MMWAWQTHGEASASTTSNRGTESDIESRSSRWRGSTRRSSVWIRWCASSRTTPPAGTRIPRPAVKKSRSRAAESIGSGVAAEGLLLRTEAQQGDAVVAVVEQGPHRLTHAYIVGIDADNCR